LACLTREIKSEGKRGVRRGWGKEKEAVKAAFREFLLRALLDE
jgi:hypothetical protein